MPGARSPLYPVFLVTEPQRDVLGLHRHPDYRDRVGARGTQVRFAAQQAHADATPASFV
jgi:hypothetical protein